MRSREREQDVPRRSCETERRDAQRGNDVAAASGGLRPEVRFNSEILIGSIIRTILILCDSSRLRDSFCAGGDGFRAEGQPSTDRASQKVIPKVSGTPLRSRAARNPTPRLAAPQS